MIRTLKKVAPGFIFGAVTITILRLMYGSTGWNMLTLFAILNAYFVGRLHTYLKEEE